MTSPLSPIARLALAVAVSAAPAAALAQFRPGEPPVVPGADTAAPPDGAQATADAFRRRYDGAHRPGVALFWNRELSDRLSRPGVQRQSTRSDRHEASSNVAVPDGRLVDRRDSSSRVTESSTETPDAPQRNGLDERVEAPLRSAFLATLASGGLHPVERSLMLRTTAVRATGAVDVQSNETQGLQGKARYLMEVLLVRDADAPLGVGFQVSVKDVETARVLVSDYTLAQPPAARPGRWIAIDGGDGFVREAPSLPSASDVGRALGLDILARLATAL